MNSAHAIYCGMRAFFVFGRGGNARPQGGKRRNESVRRQEETRVRKAEGRDAPPLGVPADLQSADKKGSTALSRICNPQP